MDGALFSHPKFIASDILGNTNRSLPKHHQTQCDFVYFTLKVTKLPRFEAAKLPQAATIEADKTATHVLRSSWLFAW